ncbi:unnamed protein product, partial [Iphiclides podalirius]
MSRNACHIQRLRGGVRSHRSFRPNNYSLHNFALNRRREVWRRIVRGRYERFRRDSAYPSRFVRARPLCDFTVRYGHVLGDRRRPRLRTTSTAYAMYAIDVYVY